MGDTGSSRRLARVLAVYLEARALSLTAARTALGLNELDVKALLYLADHPRTRPSILRGYLGLTSAGVTTLADRLIDRGAVIREVDPEDRRATLLSVVVDLHAAPWDALTRFDADLACALQELCGDDADMVAARLEEATRRAGGSEDASAQQRGAQPVRPAEVALTA